MGELHTMPSVESRLLAESIPSALGPVPPEVMALTIKRLRRCGVRLTTSALLGEKTRTAYSSLFGTMAGLEWANQQLKQVARDQAERIAQLESRLLAMEGEK